MPRDPQLDRFVTVEGKDYELRFTDLALFELEGVLGCTIADLHRKMDRKKLGVRELLAMLFAGLEGARDRAVLERRRGARQTPWTVSEAAALVEPLGGVLVVAPAIREAYFAHALRPKPPAPAPAGAEDPAPEGKGRTSGKTA